MFEIYHVPNPQNDSVWAELRNQALPVDTVKQPAKPVVWGAMLSEALSELHIIHKNQAINTKYYVSSQELEGPFSPARNRSAKTDAVTEMKMVDTRSNVIFMQEVRRLAPPNKPSLVCPRRRQMPAPDLMIPKNDPSGFDGARK